MGAACAGAGNQTAVTDDGGICGHVCIAHLILAAGIAGGIPAVGDAQVCQDGRAGADGGNEPAVVPGPLQGIQGGLTGPGTGNAAQAAGQYDHIQGIKIDFLRQNVGFDANIVAAVYGLSGDAHGFYFDPCPPQKVHRGNGLNFFKAGAQ